MYHIFPMSHLSFFCVLAIVYLHCAAMNIGVHVSFQIMFVFFSGYMPRSRIVGSCGSYIFSFFKECPPYWYIGCANLHSHISKNVWGYSFLHTFCRFFFMFTPTAYGNSWAGDWIWGTAVNYTTATLTAHTLTHCAWPGIEPTPLWQPEMLQQDS